MGEQQQGQGQEPAGTGVTSPGVDDKALRKLIREEIARRPADPDEERVRGVVRDEVRSVLEEWAPTFFEPVEGEGQQQQGQGGTGGGRAPAGQAPKGSTFKSAWDSFLGRKPA